MAHLYNVTDIPDDDAKDRKFGGVLKKLRTRSNFTPLEVHLMTRISEARLLSLETGHCLPSIKPGELRMLASLYMVEMSDLLALLL